MEHYNPKIKFQQKLNYANKVDILALNHLAQEGHIVQKHGKGGFAAYLAVHKHVSQFSIFTDDMRSIDNASCSASKNGHGRTKVITHSLFHKSERDKV